MKKNLITAITSTVISFLLIYFLSFLIVDFKNHEEFHSFLFKEMESLNFHKKYSKKMHHIRTINFETPNNLEDSDTDILIILFIYLIKVYSSPDIKTSCG